MKAFVCLSLSLLTLLAQAQLAESPAQGQGPNRVQNGFDPVPENRSPHLWLGFKEKAPRADFTYQANPKAPLEITFDASTVIDANHPDGDLSNHRFEWHFGDGQKATLKGRTSVIHTYKAGDRSYNVFLKVTDPTGLNGYTRKQVEVSAPDNRAPVVELLKPEPADVQLGQEIVFVAQASDPDGDPIVHYLWDFGDGQSRTTKGPTTTHLYQSVGNYIASVVAVDSHGLASARSPIQTVGISSESDKFGTVMIGRVMDSNARAMGQDIPLRNARVIIREGATQNEIGVAITDEDGGFHIANLPAVDMYVLFIDAAQAVGAPGFQYTSFLEPIGLKVDQVNTFARPFYLGRVVETAQVVPDEPTVLTTLLDPTRPETEIVITVPANSATFEGEAFTGAVGVANIPPDLAPAQLPEELGPGILISVQPTGVIFEVPAQVRFPNVDQLPPGTKALIWSMDADNGRFTVVADGVVSDDGRFIDTDPAIDEETGLPTRGIRSASWHAALPPGPSVSAEQNNSVHRNQSKCAKCTTGSQTSLADGDLTVTHPLVAMFNKGQTRQFNLIYNSQSAAPMPLLSSQTSFSVRPPRLETSLRFEGQEVSARSYYEVPTDLEDGAAVMSADRFDASAFDSGLYALEFVQTQVFSASTVSTVLRDRVLINNLSKSPFGAGWNLDVLDKIVEQSSDGRAVFIGGDSTMAVYEPMPTQVEQNMVPGLKMTMYDVSGVPEEDFQSLVDNSFDGIESSDFTIIRSNGEQEIVDGNTGLIGEEIHTKVDFDKGGFLLYDRSTFTQNRDSGNPPEGEIGVIPPGGRGAPYGIVYEGFLNIPEGGNIVFGVNGTREMYDKVSVFLDGDRILNNQLGVLLNNVVPGIKTFKIVILNTGNVPASSDLSFIISGGGVPCERQSCVVTPDTFFYQSDGARPSYISPPGDFATLEKPSDATFVRTTKTGEVSEFSLYHVPKVTPTAGSPTQKQWLITRRVDKNGNTYHFDYHPNGNLSKITDPAGQETTFNYADGKVGTISDGAGRVTTLDVDGASGNLMSISDPSHKEEIRRFHYGPSGHLLRRQTTKRGHLIHYDFDENGRNFQVRRPDKSTRRIESVAQKLLDRRRQSAGEAQMALTPAQVKASLTDGRSLVTTYTLNRFGQVVREEQPNGAVIVSEYDDKALLERRVKGLGNGEKFTYDEFGNLKTKTLEIRSFGEKGEVTSTTELVSTFAYDSNYARETSFIDPKGREKVTEIYPPSAALDARGNPETVTGRKGGVTSYTYTAGGQVDTETEQVHSTDESGEIVETRELVTDYNYNQLGQLEEKIDPNGHRTHYSYDSAGNLDKLTVFEPREGESDLALVTNYDYDSMNRLEQVVRPNGERVKYEYNRAGKMSAVVDLSPGKNPGEFIEGNRYSFTYDEMDRLETFTDPHLKVESRDYDGNGNLKWLTSRTNETIHYRYDEVNNLREKEYPNGAITVYRHDDNNNLKEVETPLNKVIFNYDDADRLMGIITQQNQNKLIHMQLMDYDENSNRSFHQSVGPGYEQVISADYDKGDNLRHLYVGDTDQPTFSFNHDSKNRLKGQVFPNNTTSTFDYDGAGNPTLASHSFGVAISHEYNARNWRRYREENGQRSDYAYDEIGQLVAVTGVSPAISYAYDNLGNTLGVDLDAGNRLRADADYSYTYDDNGNLKTKTNTADTSGWVYDYDVENRLIRVSKNDKGIETVTTYEYDGLGRRVAVHQQDRSTYFIFNGDNIVAEYSGENELLATYIHDFHFKVDEPLSMNRAGSDYYFHRDPLGSIIDLTGSEGQVVQSYSYSPFGLPAMAVLDPDSGQMVEKSFGDTGTIANAYSFGGRSYDAESGLYHMRARAYDPASRRFLQQDPIRFEGGDINLYRYTGNNPVNLLDPFGEFSFRSKKRRNKTGGRNKNRTSSCRG